MVETLTKTKRAERNVTKKIPDGDSLNSKHPNPYEVAYKQLWDELPEWKKMTFALERAKKTFSQYGIYAEFVKSVVRLAEEI